MTLCLGENPEKLGDQRRKRQKISAVEAFQVAERIVSGQERLALTSRTCLKLLSGSVVLVAKFKNGVDNRQIQS